MAGITRDDWLQALKAVTDIPVPPSDPDVMTVNELADIFGLRYSQTYRNVRALVAAGKAIPTTKTIKMTNGVHRVVTAYRLVKADAAQG